MPHGNIMGPGASKVVQSSSVTFLGYDAQVDLHAAFENNACTCGANHQRFGNLIIGDKTLHNSASRCCCDHNIEIPNGLAHASVTARDSYLCYARYCGKVCS